MSTDLCPPTVSDRLVVALAPVAQDVVAEALANATSGRGGPFAAAVVDVATGAVVGRGRNTVTSDPDPTAHAEVNALRAAALAVSRPHLDGLAVVASCEPCPMCIAACLWAHVDAVLYVATRADAAAAGFDDAVFDRALGAPDRWPDELAGVRVLQVPHADGTRPFRAWQSFAGRRPY